MWIRVRNTWSADSAGRASVEDLSAAVVRVAEAGIPITVGDLGEVRVGAEPKRGTASYKAQPAVILSVQKQPGANTLDLTRRDRPCPRFDCRRASRRAS